MTERIGENILESQEKAEQLENGEAETNPTIQITQNAQAYICQFIKQKMARLNENTVFVYSSQDPI